jgi:hypothetical protein
MKKSPFFMNKLGISRYLIKMKGVEWFMKNHPEWYKELKKYLKIK